MPPPPHTHHTHTHTHTASFQSLGETHIDLGPATVPPPVPAQVGESRDQSYDPPAASRLVGKDGDIMDDVIDDIIAQASSSSSSSSEDEAGEEAGEDTAGLAKFCFVL